MNMTTVKKVFSGIFAITSIVTIVATVVSLIFRHDLKTMFPKQYSDEDFL